MHHASTSGMALAGVITLFMFAPGSAAQAQTVIQQQPTQGQIGINLSPTLDEAVGQTFTAPTDSLLTEFALYQSNFTFNAANSRVELVLHIAAWDGTAPGSDLATSAPYLTPQYDSYNDSYVFRPPNSGLALVPGQQYIAYFTRLYAPDYLGTTETPLSYANGSGTDYTGGSIVYQPHNQAWQTLPQYDAAFYAAFSPSSPVPESSTTISFGLLLALGMGGLLVAARRKKGRAAA